MAVKEKITVRQFGLIVFVSRSVLPVSTLLVLTGSNARQDAWIAAILATLLGTVITWVTMTLAIRYPRETVVEYTSRLLGRFLGKLAGLVFLWLFLHHAAIILRTYGEALGAAILPETPPVFVMGVMILLAGISARYGIEVIGRMADFVVPIFILATVLVILLSTPLMDKSWLQPVLAGGFKPVLLGTVTPVAWFTELLYILIITPHVTQPRQARTVATVAAMLAGCVVIVMTLAVLMVFGPNEGIRQAFPAYSMARLISVGEFLERVEIIPLTAWTLGLFMDLSILYYSGAKGLSQWFGLERYRPLVLPMGAILLSLSLLLFEDFIQFKVFELPEHVGVYKLGFVFPWVLLLLLVSLIREGKKEADTEGDSS